MRDHHRFTGRFALATGLLAAATSAFAAPGATAAELGFVGGASGMDPLGNLFSFDGTTFLLNSGPDGFNPLHQAVGSDTSVRGFSISMVDPAVFNPEPVLLPNACPPGQYAVYLSLNPLVIVCMGLGTGTIEIRNTWTYLRTAPGTVSFGPADGSALTAGESFEFRMTFSQPIDPASFSFSAAWSDVSAVPESNRVPMLLLGLAALGGLARRPAEGTAPDDGA